jgi:hypothetical protein
MFQIEVSLFIKIFLILVFLTFEFTLQCYVSLNVPLTGTHIKLVMDVGSMLQQGLHYLHVSILTGSQQSSAPVLCT